MIKGTRNRRKYVSFNSTSAIYSGGGIKIATMDKMEIEMEAGNSTFQCNPALKRRSGETCLPPDSVERLVDVWNKSHPDRRIPRPPTRKNGRQSAGNTHRKTWRALRKAMRKEYKCETEYCMVKKLPGLNDSEKKPLLAYYRPELPTEWDKKPTTWLDSYNIEDVMHQYEQAEPSFEFIGPTPIDFDAKDGPFGKCILEELCKLNLQDCVKRGKTKIGIIFNLDPHDQPGSHWVCGFIDIPAKSAYYFDSYGYSPEKEIKVLLKRCHEQGMEHVYFNDIRHQRKGSECGMYCLYVIICLLRGRSFDEICKNVVRDDLMNSFRKLLFAEETTRQAEIDKALPKICL